MKTPIIKVQFGNYKELNKQIKPVYVKSLNDAIRLARGDKNALQDLRLLVLEAKCLIDQVMYETIQSDMRKAAHLKVL